MRPWLEIAMDKTEIIMLAFKMKTASVAFEIINYIVNSKESAKYLGVWVCRDLHLGRHMTETASRADKVALALSSLMPNRGRPRELPPEELSRTWALGWTDLTGRSIHI